MSIQRWMWIRDYPNMEENHSGKYVLYKDHVAAVAAAVEFIKQHEGCADAEREEGYDAGFTEALKAAREAVAAHIRADLTGQEMFCGRKRGILAAIDALTTRNEGRNTG